MNKANHARHFNTRMPSINEEWASKVLGIPKNGYGGPDLKDARVAVEIKFAVEHPKDKYYWTTFEYQRDYRIGVPLVWGVGSYRLSRPISQIRTYNLHELEGYVEWRKLWLIERNWANRFDGFTSQGETEKSKWNHKFLNLKSNQLPPVIKEIEVEKGLILLTQGVPEELFPNIELGKLVEEEAPF